FMQRYHDVISSFGGKTSYDADNRPLLVMRSNLWASGYDVDGTDQTSLGQFSGRVQQTYKHSVSRFFVAEHGTMFSLALVRFPLTVTNEIQYLTVNGALSYTNFVVVAAAFCVWKRNIHDFGFLALKCSRMMRAHIRRAARNFATSSRKLLCALKKNESRGANLSTSSPACSAAST